jgi:hypothetical protein
VVEKYEPKAMLMKMSYFIYAKPYSLFFIIFYLIFSYASLILGLLTSISSLVLSIDVMMGPFLSSLIVIDINIIPWLNIQKSSKG